MMNPKHLVFHSFRLIIGLIIIHYSLSVGATNYWSRAWFNWDQSSQPQEFHDVIVNEHGYTAVGNVNHYLQVTNFTRDGELVWSSMYNKGGKEFKLATDEMVINIGETSDGGFVLSGRIRNTNEAYLLKFDGNHGVEWGKAIKEGGSSLPGDPIESSDGNIMVWISVDGLPAGNLLKVNGANGALIWSTGYQWMRRADEIIETNDNGFISCGVGYDNSYTGWFSMGVTRVNSFGQKVWAKFYSDPTGHVYCERISEVSDGGYILLGRSTGNYKAYVTRIDSNGNHLWTRRLSKKAGSYNFLPYGAEESHDGSIVVIGHDKASGGLDGFIMNINSTSHEIVFAYWDPNGLRNTYFNRLRKDPVDQSLVMVGRYLSGGKTRALIAKLDPDGRTCFDDGTWVDMVPSIDFIEYTSSMVVYNILESHTAGSTLSTYTDLICDDQEDDVFDFLEICWSCQGIFKSETNRVCSGHGDCLNTSLCDCNDNYYNHNCSVTTCYGELSNTTNTSILCSGHGVCPEYDSCQCIPDNYWFEETCNTTGCFGKSNLDEDVCNKVGSCIGIDICVCDDPTKYFGSDCNATSCFGVWNNQTQEIICSNHGACYHYDVCTCDEDYFGSNCSVTLCDFIISNETSVCSNHGQCLEFNKCSCEPDYYGDICNVTKCNNVLSNETMVCKGHGFCTIFEECQCDPNYCGEDCNITTCFGLFSNVSESCNDEFGVCLDHDLCECVSDYYGIYCNFTTCYDKFSNESSVCHHRNGECVAYDQCVCSSEYFGTECNITTCYGILNNQTSTPFCSGNGDCIFHNNCECHDNYFGEYCNITTCFGVLSNETSSTCSTHGKCEDYNTCECDSSQYYYGERCNITICFDILSNETEVCSSHGNCIDIDDCQCQNDYFGLECNVTTCESKFSNVTDTCTKYGSCTAKDICECWNGYYGEFCNITQCYGYFANSSNACYNHGECWPKDTCKCDSSGEYFGKNCNVTFCEGQPSNLSVCSNHGYCLYFEECYCFENYYGKSCNVTTCNLIFSNDTQENYCHKRGDCNNHNNCGCEQNYYGYDCEVDVCNGIFSNETSRVCNGNGNCTDFETCVCDLGYFEDDCNVTMCNGIFSNDSFACSGHGNCTGFDDCACKQYYDGSFCEINECDYIKSNNPLVCNEKGNCTAFQTCECFVVGYHNENGNCVPIPQTKGGPDPDSSGGGTDMTGPILAGALGGTFAIVLVIVILCCISFLILLCCVSLCCLCVLCCLGCTGGGSGFLFFRRNRKLSAEEQFALDEGELDGDETSLANLDINNSLFEVNIREIKLLKILGKGGSDSTVYKADFKGVEVAFKNFRTSDVCGSQSTFDEFEKEVSILSSISHPGTLRFYGAVLEPPRVGIVMEYCSKGDVIYFLRMYKKNNDEEMYPLKEKVRMLVEIALAMRFLHSRGIIHRDLKPENVLLNEAEACKVMDFGCSRLLEHVSTMNKTTRIGTPHYMAPEIVLGDGSYNEKVDVFSFAVMIYTILTEKFDPYPGVNCVELKVANDPDFRPDIRKGLKKLIGKKKKKKYTKYKWLVKMAKKCWRIDPDDRYSFEKIIEIMKKKSSVEIADDDLQEEEKEEEEEEEEKDQDEEEEEEEEEEVQREGDENKEEDEESEEREEIEEEDEGEEDGKSEEEEEEEKISGEESEDEKEDNSAEDESSEDKEEEEEEVKSESANDDDEMSD